ncbi:hypothetical protein LC040_07740 [Bacillus tianshenii]|nr:hypothetical protein LC040_07740 [Bacillus tianshenii]
MGKKQRNRLQPKKNNHLPPEAEETLEREHARDMSAEKRKPTQNNHQ